MEPVLGDKVTALRRFPPTAASKVGSLGEACIDDGPGKVSLSGDSAVDEKVGTVKDRVLLTLRLPLTSEAVSEPYVSEKALLLCDATLAESHVSVRFTLYRWDDGEWLIGRM